MKRPNVFVLGVIGGAVKSAWRRVVRLIQGDRCRARHYAYGWRRCAKPTGHEDLHLLRDSRGRRVAWWHNGLLPPWPYRLWDSIGGWRLVGLLAAVAAIVVALWYGHNNVL